VEVGGWEGTLIHCWQEYEASHYGNQCGGSQKIKTDLLYDPAIPLWAYMPKNQNQLIIETPV
jgi:hypothetical protein